MREPFEQRLRITATALVLAFYVVATYAALLGLMWIIELLFG